MNMRGICLDCEIYQDINDFNHLCPNCVKKRDQKYIDWLNEEYAKRSENQQYTVGVCKWCGNTTSVYKNDLRFSQNCNAKGYCVKCWEEYIKGGIDLAVLNGNCNRCGRSEKIYAYNGLCLNCHILDLENERAIRQLENELRKGSGFITTVSDTCGPRRDPEVKEVPEIVSAEMSNVEGVLWCIMGGIFFYFMMVACIIQPWNWVLVIGLMCLMRFSIEHDFAPKVTKQDAIGNKYKEVLETTLEEISKVKKGLEYGLYTKSDLQRLQVQKTQLEQTVEDYTLWKKYFRLDYPEFEDCRLKMEYARKLKEESK